MATAVSGTAYANGSDAAAGANNPPASHPFTCNTCQVAFRSSDAQRGHMRTDWHRYNLKRRVASLPPISSETFAEKVISAQASNSAAAAKATFERFCEACQKTYYSENAFINHLGSQKHKAKEGVLRKEGTKDETGSVISGSFSLGEPINEAGGKTPNENGADEDLSEVVDGLNGVSIKGDAGKSQKTTPDEGPGLASEKTTDENYPLLHCLFCNYKSPNLKLNVYHMGRYHGMFIPEKDYLVDLEGLLKYFFAKITENNECLYCHKMTQTTSGIQTHMRDKGHCMIAFETEDEMLEVGQFYDFSSTYSDEEDEESDDQEDTADTGADEGWETDSSESSVDSDEIGAVPIEDHSHQYAKLPKHKHHSHRDPRPHRNADGYHSHGHDHGHAAFYSDFELHLPSGRTAGHRSLARYYRQNLRNYAVTPDERVERQRAIEAASSGDAEDSSEQRNTNRALTTRENGGIGMLGATDSQKKEVRTSQAKGRDLEQRARRQYQRNMDRRSNNQKHFRDHLLQ